MKDDGSLRLYNLPETRVCKAVRGLGSDVSSIAWVHPTGAEVGNALIAAGNKVSTNHLVEVFAHRMYWTQILLFSLDAPSVIQDASQSLLLLDGIIDPDDVFNEVTVFDDVTEEDS